MEYSIRLEAKPDYYETEYLMREAFWGIAPVPREDLAQPGRPGCDEHLLTHKMRQDSAFVPALAFVAQAAKPLAAEPAGQDGSRHHISGGLVGGILYMRAVIRAASGAQTETLIFGPLGVRPDLQGTGIGGALVRHSLAEATRLGFGSVFIYGHPDYYPRFGFAPAARFGVTTADGKNFDAFMGLELHPGALDGVKGRFFYPSVYDTLPLDELLAFDRQFPARQNPFV